MANPDIIVIGAGHNGLVAATYLAKAGRKVLVLERRAEAGGQLAPIAYGKDFDVDPLHAGGRLRPTSCAISDLRSTDCTQPTAALRPPTSHRCPTEACSGSRRMRATRPRSIRSGGCRNAMQRAGPSSCSS